MVRAARAGSRASPNMTTKNLTDMIAPVIHLNEVRSFEIPWVHRKQGIGFEAHYTVVEMDQWLAKMQDTSAVNPLAPVNVLGNTFANYTFWDGGMTVKYTIQNSHTFDAIIDIVEMIPRRCTNVTPGEAWIDDLAGDNTISNLQAPIQTVDRSFDDIDTRPGATGQKFNMYYRKKYLGRTHLRGGEEYVFTYNIPGFSYNVGKYNQHVDTTNSVGSDRASFFDKTRMLYFFCKGQAAQDLSDTDVTLGAGKLSIVVQRNHSYRCMPTIKTDQYVYVNALPTVISNQGAINRETGGTDSAGQS